MRAIRSLAILVVLLGASSVVLGQQSCEPADSFDSCVQRIYGVPPQALDESKGKQQLAKAQTGADSGGTATASTLMDLVPLFDAVGLLSNTDDGGGTLSFNLNFLLPVQRADNNAQLKLVANTSPQPLTQLVDAFPETVRGARKDSLQKSISTFGDSKIEFSWSLVNSHFGRDFTVARPLLAPLYEGAGVRGARTTPAATASAAAVQVAADRSRAVLTRISRSRSPDGTPFDVSTSTPFKAFPPAAATLRDELMQAAAETGLEMRKSNQGVEDELGRSMVAHAADLVEQQPQLLFSLSRDIRDSVTGPEKTSATLSWEFTSVNLSSFLGGPGAICRKETVVAGGDDYVKCADALSKYLGDNAVNLTTQARWKLSASYQRVKAIDYRFPDDNVTLGLPKTDRIEVSAAWGRPLQAAKDADRVDVEVDYDSNIKNDTSNKERVKATVTYTRRIGDMDVPFAIVYANKNEFLGKVDHQISLHLGVKFKPPAK